MTQETKTICDFCPEELSPEKDYSIYVDKGNSRKTLHACERCAHEKLGQLSKTLTEE